MTRENMGCDPEFFIVNDKDEFVPAHRVGIPQKLEKPAGLERMGWNDPAYIKYQRDIQGGKGVQFFRDGAVMEINTRNPATCRAGLISDVKFAFVNAQNALPKGYRLKATAAMPVDLEDLLSDAPPDVREFGCNPSYDAYTGQAKYPGNADQIPYRFAGGHIHLSTVKDLIALWDKDNHPQLIKWLDLYVGAMLATIYNDDSQWIRRQWYGQAGEYRSQVYGKGYYGGSPKGVEYRTPPSDMWKNPAIIGMVYGVARWVVKNFTALKWDKAIEDDLQAAINFGDKPEKMLRTVPGYYTPEIILALRKQPKVYEFRMLDTTHRDSHAGWSEHAKFWGLKLPAKDKSDSYDYVPSYKPVVNFTEEADGGKVALDAPLRNAAVYDAAAQDRPKSPARVRAAQRRPRGPDGRFLRNAGVAV